MNEFCSKFCLRQTFTSKNGFLETFGNVTYASMGGGYAAVTKGLTLCSFSTCFGYSHHAYNYGQCSFYQNVHNELINSNTRMKLLTFPQQLSNSPTFPDSSDK